MFLNHQSKLLEHLIITENTTQPLILTPNSGYDAIEKIEVNVNVPNQTGNNPLNYILLIVDFQIILCMIICIN